MCRRSLSAECWKSERLDLTLVHVAWTLIMVRPRCEAGNNAQHGSSMCFFMRGSGTCIISSTSSTIWASNLHVCLHTCADNICECCCLTHQDHNFLLLHTNIYNLACEQSLHIQSRKFSLEDSGDTSKYSLDMSCLLVGLQQGLNGNLYNLLQWPDEFHCTLIL